MDNLTTEERSEIMSRVRSRDTKPEMIVRRLVHSLGYRYRLHLRSLPGAPDLVFTKRKKVIFVHGCYWHRHDNCPNARIPKSHVTFWQEKLEGNRDRDERNEEQLRELGWDILVVWECQLRDHESLKERIRIFLEDNIEVG